MATTARTAPTAAAPHSGAARDPASTATPASPTTVVSADGSRIAFERFGAGPAVILIGGALNDRRGRASGTPLARLLAGRLTAIAYDRRGRGDSTENRPYAVAREIDDLRAVIATAGGSAALFGMSSGAALAIAAGAAGLPVTRVAVYDPPFSTDAARQAEARAYDAELTALTAVGDNGGALALFLGLVGMPPAMIDGMRRGPGWAPLAALAPTLTQDAAVLDSANGAPVPLAALAKLAVPVLALAGGAGAPMLRRSAEQVAAAAPRGSYRVIAGETHDVAPAALAPELIEFIAG